MAKIYAIPTGFYALIVYAVVVGNKGPMYN